MDISRLVPEWIQTLTPYQPGKPIEELEREYGVVDSTKIASNENPLGPSPKALQALARKRAQTVKAPPSEAQLTAEARRFFRRGVKLYEQGEYAAAIAAFEASQRFTPVPELNYNLGMSAQRLGRKRDAGDYFRAYLRERPKATDRSEVERRITALETR